MPVVNIKLCTRVSVIETIVKMLRSNLWRSAVEKNACYTVSCIYFTYKIIKLIAQLIYLKLRIQKTR